MKARATTLVLVGLCFGCNSEPDVPYSAPLYRNVEPGECSSGERGNMMINEVHHSGSVRDDGTYDADDVFIEFWNRHPRPINISNWRINIWRNTPGYESDDGYLVPEVDRAIEPNGYFVLAKKDDGAFAGIADAFLPEMEIGKTYFHIELRDCDGKLMEDAGSREHEPFAGGYDTVTSRSMERAQLIFQNRGGQDINWHFYSLDRGSAGIAEEYRDNTLASPGLANSPDYSGSAASGGFE